MLCGSHSFQFCDHSNAKSPFSCSTWMVGGRRKYIMSGLSIHLVWKTMNIAAGGAAQINKTIPILHGSQTIMSPPCCVKVIFVNVATSNVKMLFSCCTWMGGGRREDIYIYIVAESLRKQRSGT